MPGALSAENWSTLPGVPPVVNPGRSDKSPSRSANMRYSAGQSGAPPVASFAVR
jgi:hypothetical protein